MVESVASISRNKAVGSFIATAAKLLETGEFAELLAALEAAIAGRADTPATDPLGL